MSTVQRITSPYVIFSDFNSVDLPRSTESLLQVVNINDFGILYSAGLRFNNRNITVRCEIDDIEVFEVDVNDIYNMLSQNDTPTNTGMVLGFEDSKDLFIFKPSAPILFKSSVKFYARANSNSSSRDFLGALVEYTRE